MGKKTTHNQDQTTGERPALPAAMSRMLGAWLGLFATAMTYGAGVLSGVSAPTALLRAGLAWIAFTFLGRILGWWAGRSMEESLKAEAAVSEPVPVPVEAEASS